MKNTKAISPILQKTKQLLHLNVTMGFQAAKRAEMYFGFGFFSRITR